MFKTVFDHIDYVDDCLILCSMVTQRKKTWSRGIYWERDMIQGLQAAEHCSTLWGLPWLPELSWQNFVAPSSSSDSFHQGGWQATSFVLKPTLCHEAYASLDKRLSPVGDEWILLGWLSFTSRTSRTVEPIVLWWSNWNFHNCFVGSI